MPFSNLFRLKSSRDRFADFFMSRVRLRGWTGAIHYSRGEFALTLSDGTVINLENMYRVWQELPRKHRNTAYDAAIDDALNPVTGHFEDAVAHLRPVIRNLPVAQIYDLQSPEWTGPPFSGEYRVLVGQLAIFVSIDRRASLLVVGREMSASWKRKFDDLLDLAFKNLARDGVGEFVPLDGFFIAKADGPHDLSAILLTDAVTRLPLKGAPVAIAATKDCIVVAGADDPKALHAMGELAEHAWIAESWPISCAPIIWKEGGWHSFAPQEPALDRFRHLNQKQALYDYGLQTPRLQSYFDRTGRPVFVSPFEIATGDNGDFTWTSWTEDAQPLIPRSDVIGLTNANGETLVRRWADVEAACGPFTQEPDFYPVRYLKAWPDPIQWSALKNDYSTPPGFRSFD